MRLLCLPHVCVCTCKCGTFVSMWLSCHLKPPPPLPPNPRVRSVQALPPFTCPLVAPVRERWLPLVCIRSCELHWFVWLEASAAAYPPPHTHEKRRHGIVLFESKYIVQVCLTSGLSLPCLQGGTVPPGPLKDLKQLSLPKACG